MSLWHCSHFYSLIRPPVRKLHKWHGQYLMRSCDSADTTDTGIIRLSRICEFKKAATVRLWPKEACCCCSCWQQPCPEWSFVQRTLTKSPPCGLSWKALSCSSNRIKNLFENSLASPCINYFFLKTFSLRKGVYILILKKKMFFLAFATVSIFKIKPTLECMSNKIGKKVNNLQVMKAEFPGGGDE